MIVESYDDVIVLSGALKSNLWETVHTAISLTLKRHPTGVIIDCSGLTGATQEGAETFRDILDFIKNHDARVIVAAVPDKVLDVFRSVSEVRSQLAITASVEEARRSLDLLAEAKPRKKYALEPLSRIVVSLTGDDVDREAVELSAQIAAAREAELHLVYVVVVPRNLPLTAPLAREEAQAAAALEKGRAILDRHVQFTQHLERGRDLASTLEGFVQAHKASLVVLPLPDLRDGAEEHSGIIRSVLQKLPQEILLVRGRQTKV